MTESTKRPRPCSCERPISMSEDRRGDGRECLVCGGELVPRAVARAVAGDGRYNHPIQGVRRRLSGPPTMAEVEAAAEVLEWLTDDPGMEASDVRRLQDALHVLRWHVTTEKEVGR